MNRKSDFVEYVVKDLLSGLDGVEARAMFGEYSLYLDGRMFALVSDEVLYFKVGESNRAKYEAAGSRQYTYMSGGKDVPMPYWEVPADVLEDRDLIARWAEESSRIQQAKEIAMASKKINKQLIGKNEGRPIQTSARNRKMATPRMARHGRGGKGKSGK